LGFFGIKETDNHSTGKPSAGVHLSVESDTFNNVDYFNPSGTGWVSGALRFDLGSLAVGSTSSITALLGIHTQYEVKYPSLDLVVHAVRANGDTLTIDFEDRTRNPVVGYLLRKSAVFDQTPATEWEPLPLPYFNDVPLIGWKRFQVPIKPEETQLFLFIQPQMIND
jgi:hypothetical protein